VTGADGEWVTERDRFLHAHAAAAGVDSGADTPGPRSGASAVLADADVTISRVLRVVAEPQTAVEALAGVSLPTPAPANGTIAALDLGTATLVGGGQRAALWQQAPAPGIAWRAFLQPRTALQQAAFVPAGTDNPQAGVASRVRWLLNETEQAVVDFPTGGGEPSARVLRATLEIVEAESGGHEAGMLVGAAALLCTPFPSRLPRC
jgi:hypothetical protein